MRVFSSVLKCPMRAQRRHHTQRLKQNRRKYWGSKSDDQRLLGLAFSTPKPCSCWMCGNPRKHWGESSLQERSAQGLFKRLELGGG